MIAYASAPWRGRHDDARSRFARQSDARFPVCFLPCLGSLLFAEPRRCCRGVLAASRADGRALAAVGRVSRNHVGAPRSEWLLGTPADAQTGK